MQKFQFELFELGMSENYMCSKILFLAGSALLPLFYMTCQVELTLLHSIAVLLSVERFSLKIKILLCY